MAARRSAGRAAGAAAEARSEARSGKTASREEALRERILDAFAKRARTVGIRAVVLADLATELGISKTTLYQQFPSKEELVRALLASWAQRMESRQAELASGDVEPLEVLHRMAERWLVAIDDFAPAFWTELARDHPTAHAIFRERARESRRQVRRRIGRSVRPEIDGGLAFELFRAVFACAADPVVCARVGLSRAEALRIAMDLWAYGALVPESRRRARR